MERRDFSLRRVGLIAWNTGREAARQKVFGFLLVLALALVVGARAFRDLNFGASELKFMSDFGLGAIGGFGAVLTVAATTQLFFSEMEHRTVHLLLVRPVWRTEFVLGKFLGVTAVVAVFCATLLSGLILVLWARETALLREMPERLPAAHLVNYAGLGVMGFLLWLKLLVLGALTLLVASYAQTPLFTMLTGFLLYVICHLQYLAQEAANRVDAPWTRLLAGSLRLLLPNFQVFTGDEMTGSTWENSGRITLYAAAHVMAAMALAIFSFNRREI